MEVVASAKEIVHFLRIGHGGGRYHQVAKSLAVSVHGIIV